MSTLFEYNGIKLSYVLTRSVSQKSIHDPSDTDHLYDQITIRVQAYISPTLDPALPTESPAQTISRIRHKLLVPRRKLKFEVGGSSLVTINSPPDAANGPHPRSCSITQITDGSFLIDYEIDVAVVECETPGTRPFVSLRWTQEQSIDDSGYSTKTTRGRLIVRSDLKKNPESLRSLCVQPIEPGFKRENSTYVLSENGLELSFTYIDREQYLMPPPPAVKASGSYTQSTTQAGGVSYGQVDLTLEGKKDTPKSDLVLRAVQIAQTKLRNAGAQVDPRSKGFLLTGSIREDLYKNVVSISFRSILSPTTARVGNAAMDLRRFGSLLPGSEPGQDPPDFGLRGTATTLQLIAAAFNDPCLKESVMRAGDPDNSATPKSPGSEANVYVTSVLPSDESALVSASESDYQGIYTEYYVTMEYEEDLGVVMLPASVLGAPASFVQAATPCKRMSATWTCTRIGAPPQIPKATGSNTNVVLLGRVVHPEQVEPTADGVNLKYTVSGKYWYGFRNPNLVIEQAAVPPWVSQTAAAAAAAAASQDKPVVGSV